MNRMFFAVPALAGWFVFAVVAINAIGPAGSGALDPLTVWIAIGWLTLMMFLAFLAGGDQVMDANERLDEQNQELADGLCQALDALHELEDETAIYLRTRGDARALHVIDEAQEVLRYSYRGVKGEDTLRQ